MKCEVAYNAVYLQPLQDVLASLGSLLSTLLHTAPQHYLMNGTSWQTICTQWTQWQPWCEQQPKLATEVVDPNNIA